MRAERHSNGLTLQLEQKDLYFEVFSMANNLSMLSKRMNLKLGSPVGPSMKRELAREQN